jgi:hypothetical protein
VVGRNPALAGPAARNVAALPGAQVIALDGLAGHNSQGRLIAEKKIDTVLAEFLTHRRVIDQ